MKKSLKTFKIKSPNGDISELRIPAEGQYICPVCGDLLTGQLPYSEIPEDGSWSVGLFDICPCCETEFGSIDLVSNTSPPGRQAEIWKLLRIRWLDRCGWSDENLQQLKENLQIDTDALKKEYGKSNQ